MRNLFSNIRASIFDPKFYSSLRGRTLGSSFAYYFSFMAMLSLLLAIVGSVVITPGLKTWLLEAGQDVGGIYPAGLEISIKDGKVSINQESPVLIALPRFLEKSINQSAVQIGATSTPLYLAVIDTRETSVTEEESPRALIVVHKEYITYPKDAKSFSVTKIDPSVNTLITQDKVDEAIKMFGDWLRYMPVILFLVFFVFGILYALSHLVYLLLASLLVYLILIVKKVPASYHYAYQVGLHALTGPMLLKLVLVPIVPAIPFLFTLILLIFVWINVRVSPTMEETLAETVS